MSSNPRRKSRNGCLRCKTRKTKCDEKKPGCSRCEDRGYQCPGYALNVRWSLKHEVQLGKDVPQKTILKTTRHLLAEGRGDTTPVSIVEVGPIQAPDRILAPSADFQPLDWLCISKLPDEVNAGASSLPLPSFTLDQMNWDPDISRMDDFSWTQPGQSLDSQYFYQQDHDDQFNQQTYDWLNSGFSSLSHIDHEEYLSTTTRTRELFHLPSALTTFFFKEVIPFYCTWDNESNVLRVMLEKMWQSSGMLNHTLQSMAAVTLSRDMPHLAAVAKDEHARAIQCLQDSSSSYFCHEDRALATFLLGHSSSWLDPKDLATHHFNESLKLINSLASVAGGSVARSFLEEALEYWGMLLAFLTDIPSVSDIHCDHSIGPTVSPEEMSNNIPHPWSGVSRTIVRMVTDTGRLIYSVKNQISTLTFAQEQDLTVFQDALKEAIGLEQRFLDFKPADTSSVRDTGDSKSPPAHFALIDDAFRYMGLLQLYRIFPELVSKRYESWNLRMTELPPLQTSSRTPTRQETNGWLTSLSIHILNILQMIPFESGTRCIQPFILVAVSSELKYDDRDKLNPHSFDVVRARNFVRSRLSAYTHILPLQKANQHYELVKQIWDALDAGDEDVYWVDMAFRTRLRTIMG